MSDREMNILAIWLMVPSFVVIFAAMIVARLGASQGTRRRRRATQLANLTSIVEGSRTAGSALTIDWVAHRELGKSELINLVGKHGWHHQSQEITKQGWMLTFIREPQTAAHAVRDSGPHNRLAAELAAALPDASGRYVLETAKYMDLSLEEIGRAVAGSNWRVVRSSPGSPRSSIVLARPGTTTAEFRHGPFVDCDSPEALRKNPAVVSRAAEIQRTKGFDPLSEHELNRARERNKHWGTKFNRQVGLAFLYFWVALLGFGVTFGGGVRDGHDPWIYLTITLIISALFVMAVIKAWSIRKMRKQEIGYFLDAYRELDALHRYDAG
ncbi:MAG: hypothetical protein ACRDQF_00665 [Thermocrispum sp.]